MGEECFGVRVDRGLLVVYVGWWVVRCWCERLCVGITRAFCFCGCCEVWGASTELYVGVVSKVKEEFLGKIVVKIVVLV